MTKEFSICGQIGAAVARIMPQTINRMGDLGLMSSVTVASFDSGAAFWTAMAVPHTGHGFESPSITTALDTTEQTIVDVVSGEGVLTQVMGPVMSSISDTATIRVTADGEVFTFVGAAVSAAINRLLVGHFFQRTLNAADIAITEGARLDYGYESHLLTIGLGLPTPQQTIAGTSIGIPFENSLKVTVQLSAAGSGVGQGPKAGCCYTNYLPQEFG